MVRELERLTETGNPWHLYNWNSMRAELLRLQLESMENQEGLKTWFQHCHELLNSGQTTRCIREIEHYLKINDPNDEIALDKRTKPVYELLAIAYLRFGEQENCQKNHSRYSCIVPIAAPAVHRFPNGSTRAIELYTSLNSKFPNPGYQWLINLAYMTLGQYPDSVPKDVLLQIQNHDSGFPKFREIAEDLGLNMNGLSGGVCIEDLNNDGLLDIFATSYGMKDNVQLFLSNGHCKFIDATERSGLRGITGGLNCVHADYDNDGLTDILILRGGWMGRGGAQPNSLLKNLGNGKFTDVTRSAGLLSYHPTQTACWADFDKDGDLDLFIGNESSTETPHFCELFQNNGNGTFSEVASQKGLGGILEYVKGVVWGDIDNDGFPELFISVMGGKNRLYKNLKGSFMDVSEEAGITEPWYSFSCWFWDVNNDGFQDLFVGSYDLSRIHEVAEEYALELRNLNPIAETSKLFINQRNGTFSESSDSYGINKAFFGMGANFGDLDNDGWLDCYIGTGAPEFNSVIPNRMFRNIDGKRFEEVTFQGRFGHVQKGHGVAFSDIDSDGDQDIYAVLGGAYEGDGFTNILFENPGNDNSSVVLKLVGTKSGRSAIGTHVKCIFANGSEIHRWVNTGGSFGSSPVQLHIGIGKNDLLKEVKVIWNNSEPQAFRNIASNTAWIITEGAPELIPFEPKYEMTRP